MKGSYGNGVELGEERTFEQDPKYAIRLLVDIAIKALSPAINDPTTAVQALDQIEDLLVRMGRRHLEIGKYHDSNGKLRLVVPFPSWDDLLRLSFDEICACGATSVQVMRRMNALLADLARAVPRERRPTVQYWSGRLKATIARSFVDDEERVEALERRSARAWSTSSRSLQLTRLRVSNRGRSDVRWFSRRNAVTPLA